MKSRGFKYKEEVLSLRREGVSMTIIEREYDIPRSTLSGWFKTVELTENQRTKLMKNSSDGWKRAREKAVITHNLNKAKRITKARQEAEEVFERIPQENPAILELALAMLYFGEGTKKNATSMGSSDPFMMKFFVLSIEKLYGLDRHKFRYDLHLRFDQNDNEYKEFWARELGISPAKISYVVKDKRTIGKPTRNGYKGVCLINIGDVSIQRRLIFLYNKFCSDILGT